MIALRFILELLIFCVCSTGPGLFALRRWRCGPVEKLCVAIGLSWVLVYLAATGIYLAHLRPGWHFAVSGLCLVLLVCSAGQFKKLWSSRQVRQAIAGFAVLVAWNVLLMSLVRHYSGGTWFGDWYEHYNRSQFFLDDWPKDTRFLGLYSLPARPPMMNLLCAHFLAQAGESYDLFQPACLLLNLLIYFPCVLIADALARRGRRQLPLLVVLLAGSPLLVQNLSFTWTKLLAGFYVILGTWLYLRGWRKQDPFRLAAAFSALAAALLVHYSAGPYLLFFALHYAVVFWRRRHKAVELLASAITSGLLLASWFGWSLWFYGVKATVGSNTAVMDTQKLSLVGNLRKVGGNVFYSLVPLGLHAKDEFERYMCQPNALGRLRDYWFLTYQQVLPTSMGILGGLLVMYLLVVNFRNPYNRATRNFWLSMIVFCTLVGIAVHGTESSFGAAHVCLQSLVLLGVTFLAAAFGQLPPALRVAAAAFAVFDFCLGVFLHIHLERLLFQAVAVGSARIIPLSAQLLSIGAVNNSSRRVAAHIPFWADRFATVNGLLQILVVAFFAILLHPLALAARGKDMALRQRPAGLFYFLLIGLLGGAMYCAQDQLWPKTAAAAAPASQAEIQRWIAVRSREADANPDSSAAHLALAEALYKDARPGALSEFVTAFMLDPTSPPARYDSVLVLWEVAWSDPDLAAATDAAETVFEHPESGEGQLHLGEWLLSKGHPGPALAHLTEAMRLSGASAEVLYAMGVACIEMGDRQHLDQAIADLAAALRLKPDYPVAEKALRDCLGARGDRAEEIDAFVRRAQRGD